MSDEFTFTALDRLGEDRYREYLEDPELTLPDKWDKLKFLEVGLRHPDDMAKWLLHHHATDISVLRQFTPLDIAQFLEAVSSFYSSSYFMYDHPQIARIFPHLREGCGTGTVHLPEAIVGMQSLFFPITRPVVKKMYHELYRAFSGKSLLHRWYPHIAHLQRVWRNISDATTTDTEEKNQESDPALAPFFVGVEMEPGNHQRFEVRSAPLQSLESLASLLRLYRDLLFEWEAAAHLYHGYYTNMHVHIGIPETAYNAWKLDSHFATLQRFVTLSDLFLFPLERWLYATDRLSPSLPVEVWHAATRYSRVDKSHYKRDAAAVQIRTGCVSALLDVSCFINRTRALACALSNDTSAQVLDRANRAMQEHIEKHIPFPPGPIRAEEIGEIFRAEYGTLPLYLAELGPELSSRWLAEHICEPLIASTVS